MFSPSYKSNEIADKKNHHHHNVKYNCPKDLEVICKECTENISTKDNVWNYFKKIYPNSNKIKRQSMSEDRRKYFINNTEEILARNRTERKSRDRDIISCNYTERLLKSEKLNDEKTVRNQEKKRRKRRIKKTNEEINNPGLSHKTDNNFKTEINYSKLAKKPLPHKNDSIDQIPTRDIPSELYLEKKIGQKSQSKNNKKSKTFDLPLHTKVPRDKEPNPNFYKVTDAHFLKMNPNNDHYFQNDEILMQNLENCWNDNEKSKKTKHIKTKPKPKTKHHENNLTETNLNDFKNPDHYNEKKYFQWSHDHDFLTNYRKIKVEDQIYNQRSLKVENKKEKRFKGSLDAEGSLMAGKSKIPPGKHKKYTKRHQSKKNSQGMSKDVNDELLKECLHKHNHYLNIEQTQFEEKIFKPMGEKRKKNRKKKHSSHYHCNENEYYINHVINQENHQATERNVPFKNKNKPLTEYTNPSDNTLNDDTFSIFNKKIRYHSLDQETFKRKGFSKQHDEIKTQSNPRIHHHRHHRQHRHRSQRRNFFTNSPEDLVTPVNPHLIQNVDVFNTQPNKINMPTKNDTSLTSDNEETSKDLVCLFAKKIANNKSFKKVKLTSKGGEGCIAINKSKQDLLMKNCNRYANYEKMFKKHDVQNNLVHNQENILYQNSHQETFGKKDHQEIFSEKQKSVIIVDIKENSLEDKRNTNTKRDNSHLILTKNNDKDYAKISKDIQYYDVGTSTILDNNLGEFLDFLKSDKTNDKLTHREKSIFHVQKNASIKNELVEALTKNEEDANETVGIIVKGIEPPKKIGELSFFKNQIVSSNEKINKLECKILSVVAIRPNKIDETLCSEETYSLATSENIHQTPVEKYDRRLERLINYYKLDSKSSKDTKSSLSELITFKIADCLNKILDPLKSNITFQNDEQLSSASKGLNLISPIVQKPLSQSTENETKKQNCFKKRSVVKESYSDVNVNYDFNDSEETFSSASSIEATAIENGLENMVQYAKNQIKMADNDTSANISCIEYSGLDDQETNQSTTIPDFSETICQLINNNMNVNSNIKKSNEFKNSKQVIDISKFFEENMFGSIRRLNELEANKTENINECPDFKENKTPSLVKIIDIRELNSDLEQPFQNFNLSKNIYNIDSKDDTSFEIESSINKESKKSLINLNVSFKPRSTNTYGMQDYKKTNSINERIEEKNINIQCSKNCSNMLTEIPEVNKLDFEHLLSNEKFEEENNLGNESYSTNIKSILNLNVNFKPKEINDLKSENEKFTTSLSEIDENDKEYEKPCESNKLSSSKIKASAIPKLNTNKNVSLDKNNDPTSSSLKRSFNVNQEMEKNNNKSSKLANSQDSSNFNKTNVNKFTDKIVANKLTEETQRSVEKCINWKLQNTETSMVSENGESISKKVNCPQELKKMNKKITPIRNNRAQKKLKNEMRSSSADGLTTTMFLTKNFQTTGLSSYEKRKLYDRKLKSERKQRSESRESNYKKKGGIQKVYEVRYCNVINQVPILDSQNFKPQPHINISGENLCRKTYLICKETKPEPAIAIKTTDTFQMHDVDKSFTAPSKTSQETVYDSKSASSYISCSSGSEVIGLRNGLNYKLNDIGFSFKCKHSNIDEDNSKRANNKVSYISKFSIGNHTLNESTQLQNNTVKNNLIESSSCTKDTRRNFDTNCCYVKPYTNQKKIEKEEEKINVLLNATPFNTSTDAFRYSKFKFTQAKVLSANDEKFLSTKISTQEDHNSLDDSGYLTKLEALESVTTSTDSNQRLLSSKQSFSSINLGKRKSRSKSKKLGSRNSKWNNPDLIRLKDSILNPDITNRCDLHEKSKNSHLIKYYLESNNKKLKIAINSITKNVTFASSSLSLPSFLTEPSNKAMKILSFQNSKKQIEKINLESKPSVKDYDEKYQLNCSPQMKKQKSRKTPDSLTKLRDDIELNKNNSMHCFVESNTSSSNNGSGESSYQTMSLECQEFADKVRQQAKYLEFFYSEGFNDEPLNFILNTQIYNEEISSSDCLGDSNSTVICKKNEIKNKNSEKLPLKFLSENSKEIVKIFEKEITNEKETVIVNHVKNELFKSNSNETICPKIDFYLNDVELKTQSLSFPKVDDLSKLLSNFQSPKQSEKQILDNLLSVYDKESDFVTGLLKDDEFFVNLVENVRRGSDDQKRNRSVDKNPKKKKSKGFFKYLFRRRTKENLTVDSSEVEKSLQASESLCQSVFNENACIPQKYFEEQNKLNEVYPLSVSNSDYVQKMAHKAKKHLEPLVKATISNGQINDKMKLAGFLKVLNTIGEGDFTYLEDGKNALSKNKLKNHVAKMFEKVYKIAERELSNKHENLDNNKIQLLKVLVTKYHIGIDSHINLLAIYIGRGLIVKETQLEDAILYLMSIDANENINLELFDKSCRITNNT